MSTSNVEIVRAGIDSINRRDWNSLLDEIASPDLEYDLSRTESPLRGIYRGREEVRRVADEFYSPWTSVRYDIEEIVEAGSNVVVLYTSHFKGRQGIELTARATWVWTLRDGKWERLVLYQDHTEALEAAGVRRGLRRLLRRRGGR